MVVVTATVSPLSSRSFSTLSAARAFSSRDAPSGTSWLMLNVVEPELPMKLVLMNGTKPKVKMITRPEATRVITGRFCVLVRTGMYRR